MMDDLEACILDALADGKPRTCPQIRKEFEKEYHKHMSDLRGRYIALQDQNIYYNADKLVKSGYVVMDRVGGKKVYTLKECCVNNQAVFGVDGEIMIMKCRRPFQCKAQCDNGVKEITPDCVLYKYIEQLKTQFRMEF